MTSFAAFDLSLASTGAAWTDGPLIATQTISLRLTGPERLVAIRNLTVEIARASNADLVCIEGYAFGRPNQAHQLGELGGAVRVGLYEAQIPWVAVPPATVKKLATGTGGAKKDAVLAAAVRRLGYLGDSGDEADARWLLEAALQYYRHPAAASLPKDHTDGLGKVGWPQLASREAAR